MHAVLQEARPEKMSPATLEALKSGDGFGWLIEGYIYIRPPLSAKRLMKLVDAKWNLSTYSEKTMGAQKQGSKSLFAQGGTRELVSGTNTSGKEAFQIYNKLEFVQRTI